jgi:hypothetical protein
MKALVKINSIEKEVEVSSVTVDGEEVDRFDSNKTTCLRFKKATVNGFTLAWATWNAPYQKWSCCCKGKGLNNNGDADVLKVYG